MRIAFPTDDGVTIQRHFGHASHYAVVQIEHSAATNLELRDKEAHHQGHNHDHAHHDHGHDHGGMFAPVTDCQVLIAGSMGTPAYAAAQSAGLEVILTTESTIESALQAWLAGALVNEAKLMHTPGQHHTGA